MEGVTIILFNSLKRIHLYIITEMCDHILSISSKNVYCSFALFVQNFYEETVRIKL